MTTSKECINSNVERLPETCALCKEKATFFIFAKTFFGIKTRFVCDEHRKNWERNELNL
jgi:hypothetical protein